MTSRPIRLFLPTNQCACADDEMMIVSLVAVLLLISRAVLVQGWCIASLRPSVFRPQRSRSTLREHRAQVGPGAADIHMDVTHTHTNTHTHTHTHTHVSSSQSVVSPFAPSHTPLTDTADDTRPMHELTALELTLTNVDAALELVRPHMISDGGNIEVVEVDGDARTVKVALKGACGSCSSSTTTMKMGVEKVLRQHFPDLVDVIAVSPSLSADTLEHGLTLRTVERALENLLPAIDGLGGSLRILHVDSDSANVALRFQGPDRLKHAVERMLLDHEEIQSVEFVYD